MTLDPLHGVTRPGLPRWVDAALAAGVLVLASPLLLLAALAVRLSSPGPALFRQERVGQEGRLFTLFKLRSMRQNGTRLPVTAADDPTITAVGRILRKTKLDELPSLWNVVRGDMSLAGPRPEVPSLVDLKDPLWREVLATRPGITDSVTLVLRNEEDLLAQAQRRFGDRESFYRDHLQRWKLDGYARYLRRRTRWTDIRILLETALAIVGWNPAGPPTMEDILAASRPIGETRSRGLRWWPSVISRPTQFVVDGAALTASFVFAYLLRFDFALTGRDLHDLIVQIPLVLLVHLAAIWSLDIHNVIWRYISFIDLKRFAAAVGIAAVPLLTMRLLLPDGLQDLRVPLSVIVINGGLSFMGLTGLRALRRLMFESWEREARSRVTVTKPRKAVLFVGAGRAGVVAVREIFGRGDAEIQVKGFVDDDPAKAGTLVHGVRVLGTTRDLPRLVSELGIDHVVITIVEAAPSEIRRVVDVCNQIPVQSHVFPGILDILQRPAEMNRARKSGS